MQYTYQDLLNACAAAIPEALSLQVRQANHPDDGGVIAAPDSARDERGAVTIIDAGWLAGVACAYLMEGSPLHGDAELLERMQRHIAFAQNRLSPEGLLSLISCNWHSPPDTAFALDSLLPVVALARHAGSPLSAPLDPVVRRMAEGVVGRGFHTPNHRWVVAGSLCRAMELWPDLAAREYVDAIVAEGSDCNADGEFVERSAGIYNAVSDAGLIDIAECLNRPDLLDSVRRNLDLMSHLLHADGSVVTMFSGRQDRGARAVPVAMAEHFFTMGMKDGRGDWLSVADLLAEKAGMFSGLLRPFLLRPFIRHPEWRAADAKRTAVPDDYRRIFPVARLWRVKRGLLSATSGAETDNLLQLEYGPARLASVKAAATYFGCGPLLPGSLEAIDGGKGVRLALACGAPAEYRLPVGRPVLPENWYATDARRPKWTLPPLSAELEVVEVDQGFDLRFRTIGGVNGLTFQLEFCFEGPGVWDTTDTAVQAANGNTALLKTGRGTFHREGYGISIGPGQAAHRMWSMRGTRPADDAFRVLIALAAPLDTSIQIRYGRWHPATPGMHDVGSA